MTQETEDIAVIKNQISEMREVLRDVAAALKKLTEVEVNQSHAAQAQARADKELGLLAGRVAALELKAPLQAQTSSWVMSSVWAAAGALVVMLLKKAGMV